MPNQRWAELPKAPNPHAAPRTRVTHLGPSRVWASSKSSLGPPHPQGWGTLFARNREQPQSPRGPAAHKAFFRNPLETSDSVLRCAPTRNEEDDHEGTKDTK